MTITNMTIFLKMLKYDYMQYDYFFEKIVIFYEKNMTKKTYGWGWGGAYLPFGTLDHVRAIFFNFLVL